MSAVIQGLWIGPSLSLMEQMSMASFLAHGHTYHLYTYNNVAGIPKGVVIHDAREILPESRVFTYKNGSYAGFSNFFRYKLLLERGGWWADTDMVCLKPWDFERDHVFAKEVAPKGEVLTSGIIKAPKGSAAMKTAWDICDATDTSDLQWGETGPALVAKVVTTHNMGAFVEGASQFCPLAYDAWHEVLNPQWQGPGDAFGLHLWNEMWRRNHRDKNARYPEDCFYEVLKRRYS